MATEPITGLTYQEANMLQTDVLQNEQLNYFSVWGNARVLSVGTNTPPVSPSEGDCYVVGTSPTDEWASASNKLAVFRTSWQFLTPTEGAYVMNADDGNFWRYLSGVWTLYAPVPNAAGVDYDNSTSGLSGTTVQDAIDELAASGSGSTAGAVSALTNSAGTVTVDCSLGKSFTITLAANVTTLTLTNLAGSGFATEIEIEIKQNGTGGYTLALPASFKALGGSDTAIASAANAVTVLSAKTFDNGTTWRYAMQESA